MTKRFIWEVFVGLAGGVLMWYGLLWSHILPYILGFNLGMGAAIRLWTGAWFR